MVELRRGIGYVIQHGGLFPHRTVLDNIATVPRLLGWDKAKVKARAQELLERVGLDAKLGKRYPAQLSGGQQQRVGVARALAADPDIMLMDEPFSAVDPIVRNQLQEELLRLQREIGKTIVFVTHDIDEAIKLGDNVAVLRVGGKLAQFAPPSELLADPADEFVRELRRQGPRLPGTHVRAGRRPSSCCRCRRPRARRGRSAARLAQRCREQREVRRAVAGRRGVPQARLAARRAGRRADLPGRAGCLRRRRAASAVGVVDHGLLAAVVRS